MLDDIEIRMTIKVSIAGLHLDARISHVHSTTPQQLFQDFTIQNFVLVRDRIHMLAASCVNSVALTLKSIYSDGTIPTDPGEIYAVNLFLQGDDKPSPGR